MQVVKHACRPSVHDDVQGAFVDSVHIYAQKCRFLLAGEENKGSSRHRDSERSGRSGGGDSGRIGEKAPERGREKDQEKRREKARDRDRDRDRDRGREAGRERERERRSSRDRGRSKEARGASPRQGDAAKDARDRCEQSLLVVPCPDCDAPVHEASKGFLLAAASFKVVASHMKFAEHSLASQGPGDVRQGAPTQDSRQIAMLMETAGTVGVSEDPRRSVKGRVIGIEAWTEVAAPTGRPVAT